MKQNNSQDTPPRQLLIQLYTFWRNLSIVTFQEEGRVRESNSDSFIIEDPFVRPRKCWQDIDLETFAVDQRARYA